MKKGNGMAYIRIDPPEHMVKIKFLTGTEQYFATLLQSAYLTDIYICIYF